MFDTYTGILGYDTLKWHSRAQRLLPENNEIISDNLEPGQIKLSPSISNIKFETYYKLQVSIGPLEGFEAYRVHLYIYPDNLFSSHSGTLVISLLSRYRDFDLFLKRYYNLAEVADPIAHHLLTKVPIGPTIY